MNRLKKGRTRGQNASARLFQRARRVIPSGVNSPVRAFRAVGGHPVFIERGKGPYLFDAAGKRYIDFCASWGPLIFGHAPSGLIRTLNREIKKGTSFGAATKKEVELAEGIRAFFPSMEKTRLVSSGTEAVMTALRLARGFTGRSKILKIDGGYHGHTDSLLVKAGSGLATFGKPDSAGVPPEWTRLTLSIPFNDGTALERAFKKHGRRIAAFIVEPIPANMGVVLPKPGYLEAARKLTRRYGALLIFDEVITGFRVSEGGAQKIFRVRPDLTCLGKILGGGLPLAAFGGRRTIMDRLAPEGPVYQAGTLSGNPVAVTAALWVLKQLERPVLSRLHEKADWFFGRLQQIINRSRVPVQLNAKASLFTLFFSHHPVTDYASAKRSDTRRYAAFFRRCLAAGLYLAPSQFEANFISTAHSRHDLERALGIIKRALT